MGESEALLERWRRAKATVTEHKRAIARTREQLHVAAAALAAIEADAARLGIAIVERADERAR